MEREGEHRVEQHVSARGSAHDRLPGGQTYPIESVEIDGATWIVRTNGHAYTMRRASTETAPRCEVPAREQVFIDGYRIPPPRNVVTLDVAALSGRLGEPEWEKSEMCPVCNGNGRKSDSEPRCKCGYCECEYCEGVGRLVDLPAVRGALIDGLPVNCNLVACALALVGAGGPCRVWSDTTHQYVIVDGEGWRVVTMALSARDKTKTYEELLEGSS